MMEPLHTLVIPAPTGPRIAKLIARPVDTVPLRTEARRQTCKSCPQFGGVAGLNLVRCKDCGCAGLSLVNGTCPRKSWRE